MTRWTTPTITIKLPDTVDLMAANNVYVTIEQGNYKLLKTGDALTVSAHQVQLSLTQAETGRLQPTMPKDITEYFKDMRPQIQLNWTYSDGSRACTVIQPLAVGDNLENEVLE